MKRILFLLFLFGTGTVLNAQMKDSTCAVIVRLYDALDSKDKNERAKLREGSGEIKSTSPVKVTVYKSNFIIPGFINPEIQEGISGKTYTTYREFATYDEAVKEWNAMNKKFHDNFIGGWTFTEYNVPAELHKNAKLVRDGSMSAPVVRYRLERAGAAFRLVMEFSY
ncbi:MAG TPA: hypothetical protein VI731_10065 [Bacteroidia bacterium]|nr:hypothetical protein [Bacteroidia bacterium]